MSEQAPPPFLRKFPYREHSTGWAVPCPDKHGSAGFAVIVSADDKAGRWRFECVDADDGDLCGGERDLVRLLDLSDSEIQLDPGVGEREDVSVEFVTGEQFVANPIPQAEPIAVDSTGSTVLAADGLALTFGSGGAGKTTLWLDGSMHLAAGIDWLDGLVAPTKPLRIGWVENEGPQEEFRRKLERKLTAWADRVPADRFHVLHSPWGALNLGDERHRVGLADAVREHKLDLLIIGPLNDLGMEGGGTPDEVRKFHGHLKDVQRRAGRLVSLIVLHHENRAGQISGAWEGRPDLLMHVTAQGHGKTRVFWQKSRWSSALHRTTNHLRWLDNEGFELEDAPAPRPERAWDDIAGYVLEHGGTGWVKVEGAVEGQGDYLRRRRDQMLADGLLINTGKGQKFELWHRDDPARPTLNGTVSEEGHGRDTVNVHTGDEGGSATVSRCPVRSTDTVRDTVASASPAAPDTDDEEPPG